MRRAAVALLLLGWCWGNPRPALAQEADPRTTVLHLSQTAERSVTRDVLRAELRVEENGADPRSVQAAINRRMDAALDRAKQAQGFRVETGSYYVGEERPQNARPRWRGRQSIILKGKDADAILKLAGALQAEDWAFTALVYEVAPETVRAAQDDLTAEALAALDRRAASVASAMHLAVLRYRDVRIGNAEIEGRPMPRFGAAAMAQAAAAPVTEPGDAVIRVTAEAELLLGQPRP